MLAPPFMALIVVPLIVASARAAFRGDLPARDYLVAWSGFFVGAAAQILMKRGLLPVSVATDYAMQAGATLTLILMSLALSHRIKLLQAERDRAAALAEARNRLTVYFPRKLVERILTGELGVSIASERRSATILFTDLTGFTDLTDRSEPERITRLLNEYLREMVSLIESTGGTLDKIMGDGILCLFGATDEMAEAEQARRAVVLGVLMQRKMRELGSKWMNEGLDHRVVSRIGIHQDYVTVGNFGSEELMSYTAIGGGVNFASRLESACEPGNILVSYAIYTRTRETFSYGALKERRFKGIARPQRVAELDPDQVPPNHEALAI